MTCLKERVSQNSLSDHPPDVLPTMSDMFMMEKRATRTDIGTFGALIVLAIACPLSTKLGARMRWVGRDALIYMLRSAWDPRNREKEE